MIKSDNKTIKTIFKNRCIMCNKIADHVHEIIPKSLTKEWDKWDNRVPLCAEDHHYVHSVGSQNIKGLLETKRKEKLLVFYGSDFENKLQRLFS